MGVERQKRKVYLVNERFLHNGDKKRKKVGGIGD